MCVFFCTADRAAGGSCSSSNQQPAELLPPGAAQPERGAAAVLHRHCRLLVAVHRWQTLEANRLPLKVRRLSVSEHANFVFTCFSLAGWRPSGEEVPEIREPNWTGVLEFYVCIDSEYSDSFGRISAAGLLKFLIRMNVQKLWSPADRMTTNLWFKLMLCFVLLLGLSLILNQMIIFILSPPLGRRTFWNERKEHSWLVKRF